MKRLIFVFGLIILIVIVWWLVFNKSQISITPNSEKKTPSNKTESPLTTVIAQNLEIPWDIVFLPDRSILVTERSGRVRLVDSNGILQDEPVAKILNIKAIGEGGLLGISIHPKFSVNNYIYLYYTYSENSGNVLNRVVRMTYVDKQLKDEKIIVDKIPGSSNHNGGRIKFGPDGYLYITTGDAQNPSQAQDKNTLGGKILRVTDQGISAPENLFNNLVFSYGHRNPQGLAWDNEGRLWATEHGPSGFQTGYDELNLIKKGGNYGWPDVFGDQKKEGITSPIIQSGGSETWAPSGAVYYKGYIFFVGLRGESIYKAKIKDNDISSISAKFSEEFGRLRAITLGPDDYFYILTNNTDGRGLPKENDDKIIRINAELLFD